MGKVKLAAHTRNKKEETSHRKTSGQSVKKEKIIKNKEYEEVGSLVHLKNSKEKKTYSNLDDRMKLLKLELESLFSDTKCVNNKENPTILNSEFESGEQCEINDKNSKYLKKNGKVLIELNNTEKGVKSKWNNKQLIEKEKSPAESRFKSEFTSLCEISTNTVEELLYKSFYLQVLGINLFTTDVIHKNDNKSGKNLRHQNSKCRKSLKKSTEEKLYQKNLKMFCKSSKKESKRRKMKNCVSVDESIEIIEVDQDSESEKREELELDVTEYDWSEPFEKYEKTQKEFSDVEIIEPCEKSYERQLKLKKGKPLKKKVENEIEVVDVKCDKIDSKRGWECPICFEQSRGQQVVATLCGHIFCKACLENYYLKFGKCCPTCRTHLINNDHIPLYNL